MIPGTIKVRSVTFAYLFGPPRLVKRDEASRVSDKICSALGLEDFTFKYEHLDNPVKPDPDQRGFRFAMERREGRGIYVILVENPNVSAPIRLLLEYVWPKSVPDVRQAFDSTSKAVYEALTGNWQKVLAEVRIRAQAPAKGDNALSYVTRHLLRLSPAWMGSLGTPVAHGSVRLRMDPLLPAGDTLETPLRELSIEVLEEDPTHLYFESMSQWAQVPPVKPATEIVRIDRLRAIDRTPSEYVDNAFRFLEKRADSLANEEDPVQ